MSSAEKSKAKLRRKSDARWRAALANCFETLKLLVPIDKKISSRRLSKANILDATSNHLSFLNSYLGDLLSEEAKAMRVPACDVSAWVAQRLKAINDDFLSAYIHNVHPSEFEREYKKIQAQTLPGNDSNGEEVKKRPIGKLIPISEKNSLENIDLSRAVLIEVNKKDPKAIVKQPIIRENGERILKVFKVKKEVLCDVFKVTLDGSSVDSASAEISDEAPTHPSEMPSAKQLVPAPTTEYTNIHEEHETREMLTKLPDDDIPFLNEIEVSTSVMTTINEEQLAYTLYRSQSQTWDTHRFIPLAADCYDNPQHVKIMPLFSEIPLPLSEEKNDTSLKCTEWMWQSSDEEDQAVPQLDHPEDFMRRNETTPSVRKEAANLLRRKKHLPASPEDCNTGRKAKSLRQNRTRKASKTRRCLDQSFIDHSDVTSAPDWDEIAQLDSFLEFYRMEREELEKIPNVSLDDVSAHIQQKWLLMTAEERACYRVNIQKPSMQAISPPNQPDRVLVETLEEFTSDFSHLPLDFLPDSPSQIVPASPLPDQASPLLFVDDNMDIQPTIQEMEDGVHRQQSCHNDVHP